MTGHDVSHDLGSCSDRTFWFERLRDRGASVVEYALLVSLIAVVCLAALNQFGVENDGSVNRSASRIVDAQTAASTP